LRSFSAGRGAELDEETKNPNTLGQSIDPEILLLTVLKVALS
jgi:hypothetical protein